MPALLDASRALASSGAWAELCAGLASIDAQAPPELHSLLAEGLLRLGRPREACAVLARAVPVIVARGSSAMLRQATNLLGAAHFELGELQEADGFFHEALAHARDEGDHLLIARASNNLALIANIRGDHVLALAQFQRACAAYQLAGHELGLAECHHNMAITYRDLGYLETADEYEQRAIGFARSLGDAHLMAAAKAGRAELLLRAGDATLAEATALHASTELARYPDPSRRADALRVAALARAVRDLEGAAPLLDEAVREARRCGASLVEAECLRARADVAARRGRSGEAMHDARAARALFVALGADREREAMDAWLARMRVDG